MSEKEEVRDPERDAKWAAYLQERQAKMMAATPEIDDVFGANGYFGWGWDYCGFGQMSFHMDKEKGIIEINNECMGKERTRKLLYAFVDYIVENGHPDCWNETWGEDRKLADPNADRDRN